MQPNCPRNYCYSVRFKIYWHTHRVHSLEDLEVRCDGYVQPSPPLGGIMCYRHPSAARPTRYSTSWR